MEKTLCIWVKDGYEYVSMQGKSCEARLPQCLLESNVFDECKF